MLMPDTTEPLKHALHPPPQALYLLPSTGLRSYTSQQFAQVSQLVVAGDGIAAYREVIELVDPVTLKAMTRDNLLSVRPFSLLAQDIPDQRWPMRTWGDAQVPDRAVVVPAVSSHLAAMKQLGKKINTVAGRRRMNWGWP